MKKRNLTIMCFAVFGFSLAGASPVIPIHRACAAEPGQLSFTEDIAPIFKGWCVSCHQPGGPGFEASGVDLRSYDGLMKGTKLGPVVIPKEPDGSTLIALLYGRASPKIRMPFGHKPLPDCLRNNIWTWIFEGAKNN